MKHFAINIFCFILPIALFFCVLEWGLRSIPNSYTYKMSWLDKHISDLKILSLGSSHGYYDINPIYFEEPAFNASFPSQSLRYDAFILDKFIERADSLKYVILPISYFSLCSHLEDRDEWWRVKNYCIYCDCPYHQNELRYQSEIIGTNIGNQINKLYQYWTYGKDAVDCDSLGWGNSFKYADRDGDLEDDTGRAKYHTMNIYKAYSTIRENKAYIEHIVHLCDSFHVRLLLVTTPVYHSYYDNVDHTQYNLMTMYCDSVAGAHVHVRYINYFKDCRFGDEDFFDSDHLDEMGATKFSKMLSNELKDDRN